MNTNALEGMQCPECGCFGPFRIAGTAVFEVTDEGVEDHFDVEWDEASYCRCTACDYEGVVTDFKYDGDPAVPKRCHECGKPFTRDADGITRHAVGDGLDRDRDETHVPFGDEDDEDDEDDNPLIPG